MICDSGCAKEFQFEEAQLVKLESGVEKTYFNCPHCQREYVAFYTDAEIRKLQDKIGEVIRGYARSGCNVKAALQKESKLKQQIKEMMDTLRKRIESVRAQ